jgi:hypothetical protein
MGEQGNAKVQQVLADWRAAERELEATPPDAPDRPVLTNRAAALREEYQRAVLQSRGRVDQVEAAADDSWARLRVSNAARSADERPESPENR